MKKFIFDIIRFYKAKNKKTKISYSDFLGDKLKEEEALFFKYYNIRDNKNLSKGIVVGEFLHNKFLLQCKINDEIEGKLLVNKIWDVSSMEIIAHILKRKPDCVMLDIGANIGAITIPLAVNFADYKFYCFEPHPQISERLQTNIRLNYLQNVSVVQKAVSDENKEISFFAQTESENMGLSSILKNVVTSESNEIKVIGTTVDEYVKSNITKTIALIKIDVQGAEISVLRGMKEVLKNMRPALIFEHEDSLHGSKAIDIRQEIAHILKEHNYTTYSINVLLVEEFGFLPELDLLQPYEGNLLALPF